MRTWRKNITTLLNTFTSDAINGILKLKKHVKDQLQKNLILRKSASRAD